MKLVLTAEQRELRAVFAELFTQKCPASLVRELKRPESDGFPAELWTALAATGALGLPFAHGYGGQGAGLFELGLFFTEAGAALCPSVVYSTLLYGLAVDRLGPPRHRDAYLPALCAGELVATVAAWNPSDAADLRPRLRATHGSDGWRLSGGLDFVANAERADVVLVTAEEETSGTGPGRTLGFVVRPGGPGWSAEPLRTIAADKQSRVRLTGYQVDDDAVLAGRDGRGLDPADLGWVAEAAVALQCAEMFGGAVAALDRTVEYVMTRHQFDRPIGSFQAVQHHVADIRIALDGARLAAYSALWWLAQGACATRRVAVAKMQCSEAYKWATLTCHQLQGGMGYVRETDLHLWSERAKVTELQGGAADVAARWLEREIGLVG
ncbi:acyl-CoA dehydrogenase family protein [Micromonospora sp. NPDC050200]|uniref:acyl-CoA dehydrogenase family protein n=1 Tax=Micromonospora sp. NPDC050200 TaxID=3155664 RepID=UPI00340AB02C